MITRSDVKKSFTLEFVLNEEELNTLCLFLKYGVSDVIDEGSLRSCLSGSDKSFIYSFCDYVINCRDKYVG